MKKNYFWIGMAAGAVIGAAASLLHKETREHQLQQVKSIKKSKDATTIEFAPVEAKPSVKDRVMEWKALYEENQEVIQNLVEDVRDLMEVLKELKTKS